MAQELFLLLAHLQVLGRSSAPGPQGWDFVNIPAPPLCGSQILPCV